MKHEQGKARQGRARTMPPSQDGGKSRHSSLYWLMLVGALAGSPGCSPEQTATLSSMPFGLTGESDADQGPDYVYV